MRSTSAGKSAPKPVKNSGNGTPTHGAKDYHRWSRGIKKETGLIPPAYGTPNMPAKMPMKKGMALTHGAKGKRFRGDLPGVGRVGR